MATPPLNFQRAIYEGESPAPDECAYCRRGITNEYFRVDGHMACLACARQAESLTPPDAHSVFAHALGYGVLAAIVGCAGYALIVIMTGWTIGYAAIGVGYLLGWAMRKAAKQHGGRRYQWAAAVLTYMAVAVAFVPIQVHFANEHRAERARVTQGEPMRSGSRPYPQNDASREHPFPEEGRQSPSAQQSQTTTPQPNTTPVNFIKAFGILLGLGLISPFLELTGSIAGGLLNLFIIFIGVRFAWQMMAVKTVSVEGPFEAATPQSPSTP